MRRVAFTCGLLMTVAAGCGPADGETVPDTTAPFAPIGTGGAVGTGAALGTGGAVSERDAGTTGGGANREVDAGTRGAAGTGGSTAVADGSAPEASEPDAAPHVVAACDGVSAVGEWQEITPPEIKPMLGKGNSGGGTSRFAVDPVNSGTVYLGTAGLGIWKTTDCGATWIHVNVGKDGPVCGSNGYAAVCAQDLDTGIQWNFEIDPVDPQILYANNGYGKHTLGELKSTNGGVDWEEIWPKNSGLVKPTAFAFGVQIDPADHLHLLLSFHELPGMAESKDGGKSWRMLAQWSGSQTGAWFLGRTTWLTTARVGGPGLWRTTDSGDTWTQVSTADSTSHSMGMLYHAQDGAYYLGAAQGIVRSTDDGLTWSTIAKTGPVVKDIVGDGTTMYASKFGMPWKSGTNLQPYMTSSENDGTKWTTMPSAPMVQGADDLGYDRDHDILYASEVQSGFWRVKTR
jgi:hypothetical protein